MAGGLKARVQLPITSWIFQPRIGRRNKRPISQEQIVASIQYIDGNKPHVMSEYQKMLDRCERGNPPEIDERIKKRKGVVQAWSERCLKRVST
jgi:hypothetical protein